jgi:hypothetical protein
MKSDLPDNKPSRLDKEGNEERRRRALLERCKQYRQNLQGRDPRELAYMSAISIRQKPGGCLTLSGEHLLKTYLIGWPGFVITDDKGKPASLQTEVLWLHYLDRADGFPLSGRWVNLSEIGGLFYQQAFQGYCGDELAESWGNDLEGLRQRCLDSGGWFISGLADLAFEWRVLPRLPLYLCYRLPAGIKGAWATMLFDASAGHYVAADVAAIVGKNLADRLKPKK